MLCVVSITAVLPRLVDNWEMTSHINRFAIGSMPTEQISHHVTIFSPASTVKEHNRKD